MWAGKSHERKFNVRAGVLMMADNKVRSARRRRYRAVSTQGMRVNLEDQVHASSRLEKCVKIWRRKLRRISSLFRARVYYGTMRDLYGK